MSQYVVGIDLGTTNSVIAYAPLDADELQMALLPIPQLVDGHTVEERTSLPSFLRLEDSDARGKWDLPWAAARDFAVGQLARHEAAEYPEHTVSGAKSWLSHHRINRRSAILPWGAPDGIPKVSPVEASVRFLAHLSAAWAHHFPDAPLRDQRIVLTVPASFDAAARELTREAAAAAGLPEEAILLEEPQSAVYAWLAARGEQWRETLRPGDQLLVCDVGGGTTDLTLVAVEEEAGELLLRRLAVGDHLLVGGDNMDLALAHLVAQEFAQKGVDLDPWQSVSLWHSCRQAKEALLSDQGSETHSISVLGRGSRLIGGTVSVDVDRRRITEFLVDGFFPRIGAEERPMRQRASGFREMGLPFETDTAVTRHLAAFLGNHVANRNEDAGTPAFPQHVLVNGGVFQSQALRSQLLDVLGDWAPGESKPQLLPGELDLNHAVARGAAHYGWAKHHGGVRIRGGVGRAYYVGMETAGLAIPGAPRPLRALCVVPFGMEEGTDVDVPYGEVGLVHGEPAEFRFFSSTHRRQDEPGDVLSRWEPGELTETAPLTATLPADPQIDEPYVPVRFLSKITELGTFELWCVSTTSDERWKLEFDVREEPPLPAN